MKYMTESRRGWLTLNNDKFLSTLGLARRANKLCYGFEAVVESCENAQLVFTASDISSRTQKNITEIMSLNCTECDRLNYSKAELGYAIGTKPVGVIAVTDAGFAKLLKSKLSKEDTE